MNDEWMIMNPCMAKQCRATQWSSGHLLRSYAPMLLRSFAPMHHYLLSLDCRSALFSHAWIPVISYLITLRLISVVVYRSSFFFFFLFFFVFFAAASWSLLWLHSCRWRHALNFLFKSFRFFFICHCGCRCGCGCCFCRCRPFGFSLFARHISNSSSPSLSFGTSRAFTLSINQSITQSINQLTNQSIN